MQPKINFYNNKKSAEKIWYLSSRTIPYVAVGPGLHLITIE